MRLVQVRIIEIITSLGQCDSVVDSGSNLKTIRVTTDKDRYAVGEQVTVTVRLQTMIIARRRKESRSTCC